MLGKAHISAEYKIKHAQLLLELRLYTEKLVKLHAERLMLHDELNSFLGEKETPLKQYEDQESKTTVENEFFNTTKSITLRNTIATELDSLSKA